MERIPEHNHLMLDEIQCKSYNDSFQSHEHELVYYTELYTEIVGINSGNIIDLGSGSCNFIIHLCMKYPDLKVTCYEQSPAMVNIARENIKNNNLSDNITIIEDDFFNAMGKYDAVLISRVLHHINDTDRFWKLVNRLSDKVLVTDLERFDNEDEYKRLENFMKPISTPAFFEDTMNSFKAAYTANEVREQVKDYNLIVRSTKNTPLPNISYRKLAVYHNK